MWTNPNPNPSPNPIPNPNQEEEPAALMWTRRLLELIDEMELIDEIVS